MFSPGAEMSGHVLESAAAPRDEKSDTPPSRVPVPWSLYDATEMIPGVGSMPGGFDRLSEPSPPSCPLAHTVTTPSAASRRWSCTVAEFGSNAPPPDGPYELLITLIGGHTAGDTPAPHGASWFSSTQFSAESAPTISSAAPIDSDTILEPGAEPPTTSPPGRVYGLPAAMPLTWVPCPPCASRSVSTDVGTSTRQLPSGGSFSVTHTPLRLRTTRVAPSGPWNAGWVGSMPLSMIATDTPVPSSGVPSSSTRVCCASRLRVATVPESANRLSGSLPST